MTDLTPNHPAVEAAHDASMAWLADMRGDLPDDEMVCVLNAAREHYTADDLRNTPAGQALMAEGWDALIESMSASGEFHDVDLRTMQRLNPYLEDDE